MVETHRESEWARKQNWERWQQILRRQKGGLANWQMWDQEGTEQKPSQATSGARGECTGQG